MFSWVHAILKWSDKYLSAPTYQLWLRWISTQQLEMTLRECLRNTFMTNYWKENSPDKLLIMLRTLLKVVQIQNTISSLAVVHIHMKRPVSGKYIGKLTAKKLMNSICQIANAQKNGKAFIKMHHALALIIFTKH